ncbi:leucine-rich repeat domain-containing protein [Streptomyces sp. NPDC001941]|uniref:leucine-rich repeat domain-containing protein n=1 Tax=Streptomyces sp. NPDC001941 TaxID=3154659 RepID=UPI00332FB2E7
MTDEAAPRLFANPWDGQSDPDPAGSGSYRDVCSCFSQYKCHPRARVGFHRELQDTTAPGWQRLLHLVDEAAADEREVFEPLRELSALERRQVITLPVTIARLTHVKRLDLYGSNLVRIPPEIGAMTSLEEFTPYTSYRLHWFPYEITRCPNLRRSSVSTRALFGNYKLRPPFPRLRPTQARAVDADPDLGRLDPGRWGPTSLGTCSVCDQPLAERGLHQVWISLRVATDVLPLLVNACSSACVDALPAGARDHMSTPHVGGRQEQPPADWA